MKLIIEKTSKEMGCSAAKMIAREMEKKLALNLCLATGATPIGCLQELVRLHKEEGLDFSKTTSFNMDEYVGLGKTHPQSYYYYLNQHLYQQVNIDRNNTFSPEVLAEASVAAANDYTKLIYEKGGIDLILLGIGRDGHISFNMPKEALHPYTHVEQLSEATVSDNLRFFEKRKEVPTEAITIGLKVILDSRKVILIADGEGKSKIIREFLNDDRITTKLPASFLRLHDDVTIILDEKAAGQIKPEMRLPESKRR